MQPQTTEAPGYRTTEFWLTLVVALLTALAQVLSHQAATRVAAAPLPGADAPVALVAHQLALFPVLLPGALSWIALAITVARYIQGRTVLKQQGIISWPQQYVTLASQGDGSRPSPQPPP